MLLLLVLAPFENIRLGAVGGGGSINITTMVARWWHKTALNGLLTGGGRTRTAR